MRKYLFGIVVIIILVLGSLLYWKYFFDYSNGYRTGLLQKFSRKGNIFKTYEGELILSSVQSSADIALASEKFFFSVVDKDVATKMDKAQGENVIIHYHEKNGKLPWRGDTNFIVDSVKIKPAAESLQRKY